MQATDIKGQRFNRLVAIEKVTQKNPYYWRFICDCGNIKIIRKGHVVQNKIKSCGCYNKELVSKRNSTHGLTRSSTFRTWRTMRDRCKHYNNPRHLSYKKLNIKVCDRWASFEKFLLDMGVRPSSKHTIDRIDNEKGYIPNNCRWATQKEQQRNRTDNRIIFYKNKKQCLASWCDELGIKYSRAANRLFRNLSLEEVFYNGDLRFRSKVG